MNHLRLILGRSFGIGLIIGASATLIFAQQARGTLRGLVKDELGAVIVGASVTLTDPSSVQKNTSTNGEGAYLFAGLAPGKYLVQARPRVLPPPKRWKFK